jgi:hypothetical protein
MKKRYLSFLAQQMQKPAPVAQAAAAPPPPPKKPNRKQRRWNELFNRKLAERFKKDQTPAEVKVLPDGGIHVHVDARSEEKKERQAAAKQGTTIKEHIVETAVDILKENANAVR